MTNESSVLQWLQYIRSLYGFTPDGMVQFSRIGQEAMLRDYALNVAAPGLRWCGDYRLLVNPDRALALRPALFGGPLFVALLNQLVYYDDFPTAWAKVVALFRQFGWELVVHDDEHGHTNLEGCGFSRVYRSVLMTVQRLFVAYRPPNMHAMPLNPVEYAFRESGAQVVTLRDTPHTQPPAFVMNFVPGMTLVSEDDRLAYSADLWTIPLLFSNIEQQTDGLYDVHDVMSFAIAATLSTGSLLNALVLLPRHQNTLSVIQPKW